MITANVTKNNVKEDENTSSQKVVQFKKQEKTIEELELHDGMEVVLEKWTFRKLVRGIRRGKIIVDHDFQRDEVYRVPQKSGIINSAMSGKSIPPLYAFEDKRDGGYVLSIIDGQQRLSSVRDFMNSQYALRIPYGELSILNGYTYEQIKRINPELGEQIGDLTLDINVIRNIDKKQAQEYFGLINTTSVPLSPGEKLWSVNDPVHTILVGIVENPYFKITNLRKTRMREYLVATKLLWNKMFKDPLKHEFVGDNIQEFMNYFNTTENVELLETAQKEVLELLKLYSEIVEQCQYSPRTQGDLYSTLCFLSVLEAKGTVDTGRLTRFIDWVFKGINKKIYPLTLKKQFEILLGNRVNKGRTSCKDFVIILENFYVNEVELWK